MPPHKKKPAKTTGNWLADWWTAATAHHTAPSVSLDLLLQAPEAAFDDLEARACDPCMLKATAKDGTMIFLRRAHAGIYQYTVAIKHMRVGEKLTLDQAKLLIRTYLHMPEEPAEDGPDDAA